MPHYAKKLSADEYARLLAIVVPRVDTPQCWLCSGARGPIRYGRRPWHSLGPSLDHVKASKDGGTWDLWNLRPAHYGCNSGRRDRAPRTRVASGRRGGPTLVVTEPLMNLETLEA